MPIRASAPSIIRRTPKDSIIAAANGPIRPYSRMLTPTANEIVARDQPNSASSGKRSRPGLARIAPATSKTTNVTAATVQA
jgi:hypothetical protein